MGNRQGQDLRARARGMLAVLLLAPKSGALLAPGQSVRFYTPPHASVTNDVPVAARPSYQQSSRPLFFVNGASGSGQGRALQALLVRAVGADKVGGGQRGLQADRCRLLGFQFPPFSKPQITDLRTSALGYCSAQYPRRDNALFVPSLPYLYIWSPSRVRLMLPPPFHYKEVKFMRLTLCLTRCLWCIVDR